MAETPVLLRTHRAPAWLPSGSRADVLLGEPPADEPTSLVRLLLIRDDEIFCVPRDEDGRLDIPTRRVPQGEDPRSTVNDLAASVLGPGVEARPFGYVRNFVTAPADDYPWPTPVACFSVWRAPAGSPVVPGVWCERVDLVERHWSPLAEHETARGDASGDHRPGSVAHP